MEDLSRLGLGFGELTECSNPNAVGISCPENGHFLLIEAHEGTQSRSANDASQNYLLIELFRCEKLHPLQNYGFCK